MRVLVIPDIHLKGWMFERADEIMQRGDADIAVCLMDIADSHSNSYGVDDYTAAYDAAIEFAKKHPETLWCCGNHDYAHWKGERVYPSLAAGAKIAREKMEELAQVIPAGNLAIIHKVDNVLFSHAGLSDYFAYVATPDYKYNDVDAVIDTVNNLPPGSLWHELSPLWLRPQNSPRVLYKPDEYTQVVGHTPVREITTQGALISCDVFAEKNDGEPYGKREFPIIDTVERTITARCQVAENNKLVLNGGHGQDETGEVAPDR